MLATYRLDQLLDTADLAAAMTIDAFAGRLGAFAEEVHALRPHPGQVHVAARLRELLDGHTLVKLEVLGDQKTLYPDVVQTLAAAETLVADGFQVMVYTSDDPILARRLEEIGCVAVMPLAAPIGSGLGVQNKYNLLEIIESAKVPVLVDAGVGTASDAAIAMELGCDGVLMNTAIAGAKHPVLMASAMRKAVEAGREAFLAGRIPRKRNASASSPIDGLDRLMTAPSPVPAPRRRPSPSP